MVSAVIRLYTFFLDHKLYIIVSIFDAALQKLIQDSSMANAIYEHLDLFSKQMDQILSKHQLLQGKWVRADSMSGVSVGSKGKHDSNGDEDSDKPEGGKDDEVWQIPDHFEAQQVVSLVKEVLTKIGRLDGPQKSKQGGMSRTL